MCSIPDGTLQKTLTPLIPQPKKRSDADENVLLTSDGQSSDIGAASENSPPVLPIGILRIVTWMEKSGYDKTEIYDINNLRPSDEELIKTFKQIKPDVV
ncbi:MAG: hypothetical protein QF864_03165, partial [SAR202 cluster bacterium]|nr:hypothetical protein [SAR202 cluster bacterium]